MGGGRSHQAKISLLPDCFPAGKRATMVAVMDNATSLDAAEHLPNEPVLTVNLQDAAKAQPARKPEERIPDQERPATPRWWGINE